MKKESYLNIRIDEETKKQLQELAEKENRTVSNYLLALIKSEYNKTK